MGFTGAYNRTIRKQIKEAFSLEIEGELKKEHRAPNGIEIRIKAQHKAAPKRIHQPGAVNIGG